MASAVLSTGFASLKFCIKCGPKLWIPAIFISFLFIIYTKLLNSMAGGTGLLLLYKALDIHISFIGEQMVTSFMRILNNDQKAIDNVIIQT